RAAGCRSKSKRIGFEALPQPICGAAGHCNETLNKLIRSGVVAVAFSPALAKASSVLLPLAFLFSAIDVESFTLLGNEARYPVEFIAATNCSGFVFPGSKSTVALFVATLTCANLTPSTRFNAWRTAISQVTQLIPSTGMTARLS